MDTALGQQPLDLEEAVESGFFLLPEVPGALTALPIPSVLGRVTAVSSPFANVVGAARLDAQSADGAIAAVVDYFRAAGLSFGWRVGPRSTPGDLGQRLLATGLQRLDNILGLQCSDLDVALPAQPEVTIRQATAADLDLLVDLLQDAFSYHAVWGPILARAYLAPRAQAEKRIAVYLAFAADKAEPVAFGSLYYLVDQPVVLLSGAATRPAYRRSGIYAHLIGHRMREAHRAGAAAAVIQAIPQSAAACAQWGFTKFCELEHYVSALPEGDGDG